MTSHQKKLGYYKSIINKKFNNTKMTEWEDDDRKISKISYYDNSIKKDNDEYIPLRIIAKSILTDNNQHYNYNENIPIQVNDSNNKVKIYDNLLYSQIYKKNYDKNNEEQDIEFEEISLNDWKNNKEDQISEEHKAFQHMEYYTQEILEKNKDLYNSLTFYT